MSESSGGELGAASVGISLLPVAFAALGVIFLFKGLEMRYFMVAGILLVALGLGWLLVGYLIDEYFVPMLSGGPAINAETLLSDDITGIEITTAEGQEADFNALPLQIASFVPGAILLIGGVVFLVKGKKPPG